MSLTSLSYHSRLFNKHYLELISWILIYSYANKWELWVFLHRFTQCLYCCPPNLSSLHLVTFQLTNSFWSSTLLAFQLIKDGFPHMRASFLLVRVFFSLEWATFPYICGLSLGTQPPWPGLKKKTLS